VTPLRGLDARDIQPRALLLHEEDCGTLPEHWIGVPAIRYPIAKPLYHLPSELVATWVAGACADADTRVRSVVQTHSAEQIVQWCQANETVEVWSYRPFTGFVATALTELAGELAKSGVTLRYADHTHDLAFFPLASKGFFPFWEAARVILRKRWI
jgi:hypothetical protein